MDGATGRHNDTARDLLHGREERLHDHCPLVVRLTQCSDETGLVDVTGPRSSSVVLRGLDVEEVLAGVICAMSQNRLTMSLAPRFVEGCLAFELVEDRFPGSLGSAGLAEGSHGRVERFRSRRGGVISPRGR